MNAPASHISPSSGSAPQKPQALPPGAVIAVFAPASPGNDDKEQLGCSELERLGFSLKKRAKHVSEGYFAAAIAERFVELLHNLKDGRVDGLVALRGGYGSTYLLEGLLDARVIAPKAIIGFSDLASLQIFLWQHSGWVTFYGPMVAAGLNAGAGAPGGYDEESLLNAVRKTDSGWAIPLHGELLVAGEASGRVLGGAMTLVEATFGTPWELDTRGAILLLEDRGMKPYQVDRVLMHFKQAGKLNGVKGIMLGDFPECEPPVAGSPTVREVCARILRPLGVPVVFGAPIGHTMRPMLTIPLGVNARLRAAGEGTLEILGGGGYSMSETKHVHVIGIGGSAMAPLAGMLREHGYRVTGSDSGVYPPASTLLESLGISFYNTFDAAHLQSAPDLVIVGNIIARGNPELEEVLDRKIPYRSLPEILEEVFLPGRHSIVVSGTHGKTTTTAMLAWIFHSAGRRPNFLVGGVAENFGKSYGLGGGGEFILEGDEYETAFWDRGPKFFHYHPDDLIITSLEFDHADIYADFETYELAFRRLVNLVPRNGRVVIWGDSEDSGPALRCAASKAFCPVETYGFDVSNDWVASGVVVDDDKTRFRVMHKSKLFGEFELAATGRHNVLNSLAAMAVAHGRGISAHSLGKALATFLSVKRRMDVKGEHGGILVVDDFAHHPTAVRATIEAARSRWPKRRLWAILEPRSNSMRRKVFQDSLPKALALADRVVLGGVFRAQQLGDDNRMDPETVAADVRQLGREARTFPGSDAIADYLAVEAKPGDLLLIMSNGSFDGLCEKLVNKLDRAVPTEAPAR